MAGIILVLLSEGKSQCLVSKVISSTDIIPCSSFQCGPYITCPAGLCLFAWGDSLSQEHMIYDSTVMFFFFFNFLDTLSCPYGSPWFSFEILLACLLSIMVHLFTEHFALFLKKCCKTCFKWQTQTYLKKGSSIWEEEESNFKNDLNGGCNFE